MLGIYYKKTPWQKVSRRLVYLYFMNNNTKGRYLTINSYINKFKMYTSKLKS